MTAQDHLRPEDHQNGSGKRIVHAADVKGGSTVCPLCYEYIAPQDPHVVQAADGSLQHNYCRSAEKNFFS